MNMDKVYEDKIIRLEEDLICNASVRQDLGNMMQQWEMMMTQFCSSQPSYHMSSPMLGYMGRMLPFPHGLPHQSTQTPSQAQSQPHVVTQPLSQKNDQDLI
ncbi:hypothetical protein ACJIZ3_011350 [Penstemon smallii]|uniref:Uncharacterized protein n=1 Tax=Penstemon smallii TaxID=265156 RepID=A0ABD3UN50_9LAMI